MKNNVFKKIVLSIVVIVIIFACLEIIQRIRHPNVGCRGMYNSLGFRNREFSIAKLPGTIRILFVGGSTTFGSRNSFENTFPFLVEEFFKNNSLNKSVEVINASWPGINSFWIVGRIKNTLYLKPDIIIVMTAYNDVVPMTIPEEEYELIDGKIVFKLPWYMGIHRFFKEHSVFYVTLREKLSILKYGKPEYAYTLAHKIETPKIDNTQIEKSLLGYKKNLEKIINLTSKNEIKLIFLKPPISEMREKEYPFYHKCFKKVVTVLQEVCCKSNVVLLDVNDFLKVLREEEIYVGDGLHFTDGANKKMAIGIFDYLFKKKDYYFNTGN